MSTEKTDRYLNYADAIVLSDESDDDYEIEDVLPDIVYAPTAKNADFHRYFPDLTPDVVLVDLYNCALVRDIPIQGKLYLTMKYICFHSNALGRVVNRVIPLKDLVKLEKKSTIGLFPNGIVIRTLSDLYLFLTFYSRDATYDLIYRLYYELVIRHSFDQQTEAVEGAPPPPEPEDDTSYYGLTFDGPRTHAATPLAVDPEDYTTVGDETIDAPVGVVYEILFGSDTSLYIQMLKDQKNYDITDSAITGLSNASPHREYSYVKPLSGAVGPKKTTCLIQEHLVEHDLALLVVVQQVTRTPDVPSGNSFQIKTMLCLSWSQNNTTRLYVGTNLEWSSKSWLRAAIEKGSIGGQKDSIQQAVRSIKKILTTHRNRYQAARAPPAADQDESATLAGVVDAAEGSGALLEVELTWNKVLQFVYNHIPIKVAWLLPIQATATLIVVLNVALLLFIVAFAAAVGQTYRGVSAIFSPPAPPLHTVQINGQWYRLVSG